MSDHQQKKWYVGAMNDALFVIDAPPRPSTDDITEQPNVNVIAACGTDFEGAYRMVAEHNAAPASRTGDQSMKALASNVEPTLIEARDELRRMFLDANLISVKRTEFIDLHSDAPHVSYTVQVDIWGTSPESTLNAAMEWMRKRWKESQ